MEDQRTRIEEIRQEALACRICELAETRTQVVFGLGDELARIVLVGEAPGADEDRTGLPFVGRAGKLLDAALEANGMRRERLWITNVVKCRPTRRSETGRVSNRPPRVGEIRACKRWIDAELNLIRPALFLCLGGPAASTLIHKAFRMTKERGRIFEGNRYAHVAMATFHPAYILRQEGEAYRETWRLFVEDLARAKRRAEDAS